MPELVVPDSVEPIIGRRCWGIAEIGGKTLLCSGHGRTIWPVNEQLEAVCAKAHTPPGEDCTCGVYALSEEEPWPYYDFKGPGFASLGHRAAVGAPSCAASAATERSTHTRASCSSRTSTTDSSARCASRTRASPWRSAIPTRRLSMDIGEEEETTVIEPAEDPVPARRESPEPAPERVEPEPEKVANLATTTWPRGQVSGGAG